MLTGDLWSALSPRHEAGGMLHALREAEVDELPGGLSKKLQGLPE